MLCISRCCGLRHVLHNRANGPESKATRMFRPVRQMAVSVESNVRVNVVWLRSHAGGDTGWEVCCVVCGWQ